MKSRNPLAPKVRLVGTHKGGPNPFTAPNKLPMNSPFDSAMKQLSGSRS